jgi:hypothetical protein
MRTAIFIFVLVSSITVKGQSLPSARLSQTNDSTQATGSVSSMPAKRWLLTPFFKVTAGYTFFNGGGGLLAAAPAGLQLSYRLDNNWYAFTSLSAAPGYTSFSRASFLSAKASSFYSGSTFSPGQFGIYSRANLGLMYVNDANTFSVSGSVGVERTSNPVFLYPVNGSRTNSVFPPNR